MTLLATKKLACSSMLDTTSISLFETYKCIYCYSCLKYVQDEVCYVSLVAKIDHFTDIEFSICK